MRIDYNAPETLTKLESVFMDAFIRIGFFPESPNYCFVDISEVADAANMRIDVAKGVLGSLAKKNVLLPDAYGDGSQIIGLTNAAIAELPASYAAIVELPNS